MAEAADLVGTVVGGKYRVAGKLGSGSVGDVYEAHVDGGAAVALKVLRVDDDDLAARFLREAKTMALFQHPHIVELVEVGKLDDGRLYFAAELVRGRTLRALLEAGPVEPRRALAIVRQILDALGHAHAMGVVHRDIKPENVMLGDGDGDVVKILDFGVAKLIGDTPAVLGEGTLTITGYGALGTPYYISPEAVLGRPLDARADLYSIGILLFELIAGKPPYEHEDVAVLMRMHAAAPIPSLPDATPELALVISEALAKKPELRFQSAAEMIAAVDAARVALELPPAPPAPTSNKSTDVFGALPLKPPAAPAPPAESTIEPSASAPAAFAPASIPSASQPVPSAPPEAAPPQAAGAPRPSQPLFAPPMPPAPPRQPSPLVAFALRHRRAMFAGMGVFVLIIIIAIVAGSRGGKPTSASKPTEAAAGRPDLARGAQELIAAGHPSRAAELIEREDIGDDAGTLLVLGHARIGAGRRLDGLAAYERAIALDGKLAADAQVRANLARVLDARDAVAGVVALELALRLDPPARDLVTKVAGSAKLGDVRRRALAIAEREQFADGIDRVAAWSLDLAQATTCEERLAAVLRLRRTNDPRAIPALKRAKTHRCVEREVAEAIAYLESRPAAP